MLLKILHFLGLTNLTDEQVERFEQKRENITFFTKKDFFNYCNSLPHPFNRFCVEVAYKDGYVAIRNSADPNKTTVVFTLNEWKTFVAGVKAGEFDF